MHTGSSNTQIPSANPFTIIDRFTNQNILANNTLQFLSTKPVTSILTLVKDMSETSYHCKSCGKKMNAFEYEMYNGYCGKCREVIDWKNILKEYKEKK